MEIRGLVAKTVRKKGGISGLHILRERIEDALNFFIHHPLASILYEMKR